MLRSPRFLPLALAIGTLACGGDSNEAAAPESDPAPAEAPAPPPASEPTEAGAAAPAEMEEMEVQETISQDNLTQTATVAIHEYSVAFIGSGSAGNGTLNYEGRQIPIGIGGMGIGGFGVSKTDAYGSVYNLHNLEDFTGTYGKVRLGATAADVGGGRLWLKNTKGVVLELRSKMQGLALRAGVDGVVITWRKDVKQGTSEAWDATKQGTKKAADSVKKVFD